MQYEILYLRDPDIDWVWQVWVCDCSFPERERGALFQDARKPAGSGSCTHPSFQDECWEGESLDSHMNYMAQNTSPCPAYPGRAQCPQQGWAGAAPGQLHTFTCGVLGNWTWAWRMALLESAFLRQVVAQGCHCQTLCGDPSVLILGFMVSAFAFV